MMFASMLGFLILIILFVFLIGGLISASMQKEVVEVKANSILHLKLKQGLEDRVENDPFSNLDFKGIAKEQPGLFEIIQLLEKAESDNNIKGVFIDMSSVSSGFANLQELRNAVVDFKKSKKFVIAYGESYSTGAYYLASAADKIYLNPTGEVDLKGLHAELMFFKGTLEKLEIEPEVIRHGKFKSAVEPFILDKMSDENRAQLASLIDDLWHNVLDNVSHSRKIGYESLKMIADSLSAQTAQQAKDLRLIDQIAYYDEVEAELRKKSGIEEKDKISFVSVNEYYDSHPKESTFGKDKVAVIYASGTIVGGK
ncbi:MAG: S49 family peptidase [Bacteroidetes bacterium]|nr:S49 family peptidase [Bacteroidota bacterium]